jgi:glycosyltransferase involved in cell wall biosynthesis
MRILIDFQGAQTESRYRGIGRYSHSLVKALIYSRGSHEIILVLNGLYPDTIELIRSEFNGMLPQNNIRVWDAVSPVGEEISDNDWRRKAAECLREAFIASLAPDFVLLTTLFEGLGGNFVGSIGKLGFDTPTAVILYDLIPLANPETYLSDAKTRTWFENKVVQCERASVLLSISESARQEAITHLDVSEERVTNISAATDANFYPVQLSNGRLSEISSKFGLNRPFLLCTGASDERKNHLRLIAAFARIPETTRDKYQLLIVGEIPSSHRERFADYVVQQGLEENEVRIFGRVDDEELLALYNSCWALVMPSWHEGFGLPVLEAMNCEKAVITSNTSSLPEVVGRPDALFDPFDVQSIADKIEQVLTDDTFRVELEKHARIQSKKFTWGAVAKRVLTSMEGFCERQGLEEKRSIQNNEFQTLLVERVSQIPNDSSDSDRLQVAVAIAQNHANTKCRQLFVDVSELAIQDSGTGIQRVTKCILNELLRRPIEGIKVELVYAAPKGGGYLYARSFTKELIDTNLEIVDDEVIEFSPSDVFLGLDLLHPNKALDNQDFYQHLRNHGVLVYFFVYDLLPIQFPQFSNIGVASGHESWLKVITNADGAICISNATSLALKQWMKKSSIVQSRPMSLDFCHLGADLKKQALSYKITEQDKILQSKINENTSFLSVGTLEPRKGYGQVLEAFELLWSKESNVSLVIIGKEGWLVSDLVAKIRQHPKLGSKLFWLDDVNDATLELAYSSCDCLVAASEGEGFGLPLIEAAQSGLPIIARDMPVFKEVAGKYAHYFAGLEPKKLAEEIENWMNLFEEGSHIRSADMPWLTWRESTEHLLDILDMRFVEDNKLESSKLGNSDAK